jgi:hypothetical protein
MTPNPTCPRCGGRLVDVAEGYVDARLRDKTPPKVRRLLIAAHCAQAHDALITIEFEDPRSGGSTSVTTTLMPERRPRGGGQ